jgi:hypothetical protein
VSRRRDPGLQAERTALAWQRTAVGAVLLALVLVWHAAASQEVVLIALTVLSGLAAATAAVLLPRSVHGLPGGDRVRAWPRLAVVVGATVVLALTGAATALVSAGASHP